MKKKIFNKRGFGLLETVIAIAILAAIALPLLNIFVQSAQVDELAMGVLNANYISQDYTEKLDTMTYSEVLADVPYRRQIDSYYLTAVIKPYGAAGDASGNQSDYAHVIIFDDNTMLAVMPDGQSITYSSVPTTMTYSSIGLAYSFVGGGSTLTGTLEYGSCVVSINSMNQTSVVSMSVTLSSSFKAMLYCPSYYTDNYTFTGDNEVIENLLTSEKSLIHVTTYVYDDAFSNEVVASLESYVALKNWE